MMQIEKISEWQKIALSFAIIALVLMAVFFNENLSVILMMAASAYWVLILPGLGLTYLVPGLSFIERLAASVAISASIIGVSSYYLGLAGIHIKYMTILLPAFFTAVSTIIFLKKSKEIDKNAP